MEEGNATVKGIEELCTTNLLDQLMPQHTSGTSGEKSIEGTRDHGQGKADPGRSRFSLQQASMSNDHEAARSCGLDSYRWSYPDVALSWREEAFE